jgi:hypothetical protein
MSSSTIKILLTVVGAAALMTTPALAATVHKGKASHHYASDPNPFASQSQRPPEVYSWDGRDLGTDPDPNIRFQLLRDQNWGGN